MIVISGRLVKRNGFFAGLFIGMALGFLGRIFSNTLVNLIQPSLKGALILFISSLAGIALLLMIVWKNMPYLHGRN